LFALKWQKDGKTVGLEDRDCLCTFPTIPCAGQPRLQCVVSLCVRGHSRHSIEWGPGFALSLSSACEEAGPWRGLFRTLESAPHLQLGCLDPGAWLRCLAEDFLEPNQVHSPVTTWPWTPMCTWPVLLLVGPCTKKLHHSGCWPISPQTFLKQSSACQLLHHLLVT
jgi:hypothetical protein